MKQETIQLFFKVKALCDTHKDESMVDELCDKITMCVADKESAFGQGFGVFDIIEVMQDEVSDFVKMMRFGWLMDDSEYSELDWQEMNEKLEAFNA